MIFNVLFGTSSDQKPHRLHSRIGPQILNRWLFESGNPNCQEFHIYTLRFRRSLGIHFVYIIFCDWKLSKLAKNSEIEKTTQPKGEDNTHPEQNGERIDVLLGL